MTEDQIFYFGSFIMMVAIFVSMLRISFKTKDNNPPAQAQSPKEIERERIENEKEADKYNSVINEIGKNE